MPTDVIKILPESLSNKIAAGEVVERPSSVVKELVENSIDAGSDHIQVFIQQGGKALIQVVDNGCGMSERDAVLAFERHSTSKIAKIEDLENIRTLGFRGEALASIASVSRVEVKSRTDTELEATHLKLEGGLVKELSKVGANRGTSIWVKNLFFNTPARRKFLRSSMTEFRHILNVINRFALAHWEIGFSFVSDGHEVYNLKKSPPLKRIREIFGERYSENLVEFNREGGASKVFGYAGNIDIFRKSRGEQFIFLNRRFILNRSLNHAVISAYGNLLPAGSFPFYVLFLEVDPKRVDVNIHPTKIEVKFSDDRLIYNLVHAAVKEALSSQGIVPRLTAAGGDFGVETLKAETSRGDVAGREVDLTFPQLTAPLQAKPFPQQKWEVKREEERFDHVNLWQLHNKYILSQIKSGLTIIDQHLAHERILYEKALKCFAERNPSSQQLLFPQTVQLSHEDYYMLMEIQIFLEKLGFMLKDFGRNTVLLEAIPTEMSKSSEEGIILHILDEYKRNKNMEIRENVAKSYACKSAIKAGDKLSLEEMNYLVDRLFATQNPYFCPHGRPIVVNMSLEEIDKRFLR